jgi:hypothetical protein
MLVCIGIPSGGSINATTVTSLLSVIYSLKDIQVLIVIPTGNVIINRKQIVEHALKYKADYLMNIDADMKFPSETLKRLLEDNKDIVGVPYNKRELPLTSTVRMLRKDGNFYKVDESLMPKELFECGGVGLGCTLIKCSVFDKIKKPWFQFEYDGDELMGEDYAFCKKAHKAGYKVWCDPTLNVKHLGDYAY